MCAKTLAEKEPQHPLILRCHRLMEAFAKSDDERDFYIDQLEGFLLFVDLDKPQEELHALYAEIEKNSERYILIPKLTFFETKKIMEGFVNEKVYDIDTKEKLSDIIQSKEARENFIEFIYDTHTELDKWQQYYQERSRIRIIEWLRMNHFHFVFEEDLDMPILLIDRLKQTVFDTNVERDVFAARKEIISKSKSYYSSEALNPRPKRGRPPKQAVKLDVTLQSTSDIYITVSKPLRPFLFTPDTTGGIAAIFSAKFETEEELLSHRKQTLLDEEGDSSDLQTTLATLRRISSRWIEPKIEEESSLSLKEEEKEEIPEIPAPKKKRAPAKKPTEKKRPRKPLLRK